MSASFGTFNTVDAKAAFGGALTETLSVRASVLYQSQSDWIDNGFTGESDALGGHETGAYRLQLLWEPNERLSALFNIHGWELDGTARVFRANSSSRGPATWRATRRTRSIRTAVTSRRSAPRWRLHADDSSNSRPHRHQR